MRGEDLGVFVGEDWNVVVDDSVGGNEIFVVKGKWFWYQCDDGFQLQIHQSLEMRVERVAGAVEARSNHGKIDWSPRTIGCWRLRFIIEDGVGVGFCGVKGCQ